MNDCFVHSSCETDTFILNVSIYVCVFMCVQMQVSLHECIYMHMGVEARDQL